MLAHPKTGLDLRAGGRARRGRGPGQGAEPQGERRASTFGSFDAVPLQTMEWTLLEHGDREHKFYCPGVGFGGGGAPEGRPDPERAGGDYALLGAPGAARSWRPPLTVSLRRHFGSTGSPAACHAAQPPTSARAFGHPARRSSRATRALVASSCHAQYRTSVACWSSRRSRARRTASSGGSRMAPDADVGVVAVAPLGAHVGHDDRLAERLQRRGTPGW